MKKYFPKPFLAFFLSSVFISMYGFYRASWLSLMTLSSIFNTNPWFNACFKFLMCITYSVLSCKLAISFSTFTVSILLGQKGISLRRSCSSSRYSTSSSRKYTSLLSSFQFPFKSLLKWDVISAYLEPPKGNFWDISHPYKLFTFQYERYVDSSFST